MSQNNQIINYLKHFADSTFPVSKQRERLTFQRNVEMVFGSTSSLMNMGEATVSPPLGSLVFWEDANGTEHCGIAVAKNGFKVYSITQQKGLTQMPQGVRAMEVRELLQGYYQAAPIIGGVYISYKANKIIEQTYYKNGYLFETLNGQPLIQKYQGSTPFILDIKQGLDGLVQLNHEKINKVLNFLIHQTAFQYNIQNFDLKQDGNPKQAKGSYTRYSDSGGDVMTRYITDSEANTIENLGHEMKHAYNIKKKLANHTMLDFTTTDGLPKKIDPDELDCVNFENIIREKTGKPKRVTFAGNNLPDTLLTPSEQYNNF